MCLHSRTNEIEPCSARLVDFLCLTRIRFSSKFAQWNPREALEKSTEGPYFSIVFKMNNMCRFHHRNKQRRNERRHCSNKTQADDSSFRIMDDAQEEQTKEMVQISKEKTRTEIATAVETVNNDPSVPKSVPPPKTANPKKKRRRTKPPVPQTSAVVESQGSRDIPAALSETSQKPTPRKRKRTPQENFTAEDQSDEQRQDVWAWKAVGQLSSYVDWIRQHQTYEVMKSPHSITQSTTGAPYYEFRVTIVQPRNAFLPYGFPPNAFQYVRS